MALTFDDGPGPHTARLLDELKKRGVKKLLCVWSDEPPIPANLVGDDGRPAPASIAFTPSAMGLIMAGEIIRRLSADTNAP